MSTTHLSFDAVWMLTIFLVHRRRELKLKENVATSHTRSVATLASRTGTSRREDAPALACLPAVNSVSTTGLPSKREEPDRALDACDLLDIWQER
jgi:hypothetical protein